MGKAKRYTHRPAPTSHKGEGPWVRGYDASKGRRCGAETVRDCEREDWSPDRPETYVAAVCIESAEHKGWHLAEDGYSWHPDDDSRHVMLPPN